MKRPTQKDVATLAGVSRSTVSYVLNDQTGQKIPISAETRIRVLDAMETLGYEPDRRAQSLRRGTSRTFGVLFQTLQNPYFVQMLDGVLREAQAAGYSLHLSQSFLNPEQESYSFRELVSHQVDGFIVMTSLDMLSARTLKHINRSGRPIVVITSTESEFDYVLTGYAGATRELMMHLFELGHRQIGFVYGVAVENLGHDRLLTYYDVLKEARLDSGDRWVQRCGTSIEDGYTGTHQLLSRADRPTALLVINDLLAIAALRAAADLGLRVPADVSIAAFDDITFASYTVPRLTTVTTFPEQDGREAVRLLLKRLAEPDRPHEAIIAGSRVIYRESTGPAPR